MAGSPSKSELQTSLAEIAAREAASRQEAFEASAWLAAIVENSDDAILSKTLDGIILSWNAGAQRLFGYATDEAIGQPITIIIPQIGFTRRRRSSASCALARRSNPSRQCASARMVP